MEEYEKSKACDHLSNDLLKWFNLTYYISTLGNYGSLYVHIMVKKEGLTRNKLRKVPFSKFLKEYHYEDWYLSNIVPAEMTKELILPR